MRSWLEVLIVSGNYAFSYDLAEVVASTGAEPHLCSTVSEAQKILQRFPICMVFSDDALPDGGFRDIIAVLADLGARIPVVVYRPSYARKKRMPTHWEEACRTNHFPYSQEEVERLIAGLVELPPEPAWSDDLLEPSKCAH